MSRRAVFSCLLLGFVAGIVVAISWRLDLVAQRWLPADDMPLEPLTVIEQQAAVSAAPQKDVTTPAMEMRAAPRVDQKPDMGEDPVAALNRLAASCNFWTQRATDQGARVFRDKACSEMRAYAGRTGQRAPTINDARRPAVKQPRAKSKVPLYVRECSEHRRGSIDYRRCRAQESRRLKEQCHSHRQNERWTDAIDWCAAYESYQVID